MLLVLCLLCMLCLEFLNSKKNGNIKDLLKRNSSSSAFPYNAFVLRPTNVGQGLFLCGQQPSASSPVTLRFICTFLGENNLNQKKIFSITVPRRHRCFRNTLYRLREVPTARFVSNCYWWSEISNILR